MSDNRTGPTLAVGAIVFDSAGQLLLVLRGREPSAGTWSLPGGKIERGESATAAVQREVAEETGLHVRVGPLVGEVLLGDFHVSDYHCVLLSGTLRAADDAADVRFVDGSTVRSLARAGELTPQLLELLTQWGCLPP